MHAAEFLGNYFPLAGHCNANHDFQLSLLLARPPKTQIGQGSTERWHYNNILWHSINLAIDRSKSTPLCLGQSQKCRCSEFDSGKPVLGDSEQSARRVSMSIRWLILIALSIVGVHCVFTFLEHCQT